VIATKSPDHHKPPHYRRKSTRSKPPQNHNTTTTQKSPYLKIATTNTTTPPKSPGIKQVFFFPGSNEISKISFCFHLPALNSVKAGPVVTSLKALRDSFGLVLKLHSCDNLIVPVYYKFHQVICTISIYYRRSKSVLHVFIINCIYTHKHTRSIQLVEIHFCCSDFVTCL
jgi:hypothetical protein